MITIQLIVDGDVPSSEVFSLYCCCCDAVMNSSAQSAAINVFRTVDGELYEESCKKVLGDLDEKKKASS